MNHPSITYSYPCDDNTNCYGIEILLGPGKWKLECWGASGGDSYHKTLKKSFSGGKGGYSVGVINLTNYEHFFLTIGGKGTSNYSRSGTFAGGFNGGGGGHVGKDGNWGGSGGGGTDIRRNGKELDDRIIIAGGGGGAGAGNSNTDWGGGQYGGAGGGINGTDGGPYHELYTSHIATGAKGDKPGERGYNSDYPSQTGKNGEKGKGGSISSLNVESTGGGGGGGYYGGGSSSGSGGGGGSGYDGGVSSYQNIQAITINGEDSFPSPFGGQERGHSGNGYIRITDLNTLIFINKKKDFISFSCFKIFTSLFILFRK